MKAHWDYREYETTLGCWLKFRVMYQWFPRRRLDRGAKRALGVLKHCLLWYVVVAGIAAVACCGAALIGLLSAEQAKSSFVGVIITSVIIAAAASVWKTEDARNKALKAQWSALDSQRFDLKYLLSSLCDELGGYVAGQCSLSPRASCEGVAFYLDDPRVLADRDAISETLERITSCLEGLKSSLDRIDRVDCHRQQLNDLHRATLKLVKEIRRATSEEQAARELDNACRLAIAIKRLYALASMTWHFPVDVARHDLIDRYVNEHMAPADWDYTGWNHACG